MFYKKIVFKERKTLSFNLLGPATSVFVSSQDKGRLELLPNEKIKSYVTKCSPPVELQVSSITSTFRRNSLISYIFLNRNSHQINDKSETNTFSWMCPVLLSRTQSLETCRSVFGTSKM